MNCACKWEKQSSASNDTKLQNKEQNESNQKEEEASINKGMNMTLYGPNPNRDEPSRALATYFPKIVPQIYSFFN